MTTANSNPDPAEPELTMIVFRVIDDPHAEANNGYQRPEALRLRQLPPAK